jgi:putative tryptophan/tyrosine transport system substrate-binding protein
VRRRDFLTTLGCAAASGSTAALAQQGARVRRVGVLSSISGDDQEAKARATAFQDGLQKFGWTEGRNLKIDYRWAGGEANRLRPYAAEIVGLAPDAILAISTTSLAALQQETRTIPIVFVQVVDPVGAGFVASMARPGGNTTGFMQFEYETGIKFLELLKELAPRVARLAVIHEPFQTSAGYLPVIEAGAPIFGVKVFPVRVRNQLEIVRGIDAFASGPDGGLIVLPGPLTTVNRDLIISLASQHRLPNVSPFRFYPASGGLASYGIDNIELNRQAASYIDRILKGEKPADLPVQAATKFQLVINLKTAKALGLDPPVFLLARTDEVIE